MRLPKPKRRSEIWLWWYKEIPLLEEVRPKVAGKVQHHQPRHHPSLPYSLKQALTVTVFNYLLTAVSC